MYSTKWPVYAFNKTAEVKIQLPLLLADDDRLSKEGEINRFPGWVKNVEHTQSKDSGEWWECVDPAWVHVLVHVAQWIWEATEAEWEMR